MLSMPSAVLECVSELIHIRLQGYRSKLWTQRNQPQKRGMPELPTESSEDHSCDQAPLDQLWAYADYDWVSQRAVRAPLSQQ